MNWLGNDMARRAFCASAGAKFERDDVTAGVCSFEFDALEWNIGRELLVMSARVDCLQGEQ